MRILVIGSGGREHALCHALKRSASTVKLWCAPGNPGIAKLAECVGLSDDNAVVGFCVDQAVDLAVIGPEQPIVNGLSDKLREAGIAVCAPSQKAAQLEASKDFTKQLCQDYQIPTAQYQTFVDPMKALDYLKQQPIPVVIKADGLAAGKGVTVAQSYEEAKLAVEDCFEGKFGEAGTKVIIEECLVGEEASVFAVCDGTRAHLFGAAQDHKRAYDGDKGPNTGGMGAYSPAPIMDEAMLQQVKQRIIDPALSGLSERGMPYRGFLFAGIMVTAEEPKLIEFNCRFGDPEAQVILPRYDGDFAELCMQMATGALPEHAPVLSSHAALCVVMASKGYPGAYEKGSTIGGLADAEAMTNMLLFHAGTAEQDGQLTASGGRVLGITGLGHTLQQAHDCAYDAVAKIDWPQGFYRTDIGWRALGQ